MSKFSDKLKGLVGVLAPTIATALGGPLAGAAVGALSKAVLGKDTGTTGEIEAALGMAKPEQLAAIRAADQQFAEEMKRLDIDLERINAGDRDSARQREIKTGDSWTPRVLAALVIAGAFVGEGWAMTHVVPVGSEMIVGRVLGTLDAALMCVLYYYFGSSSGSAQKNQIMAAK